MENKTKAFARLLTIMDELREKCPWDQKQTHNSLKKKMHQIDKKNDAKNDAICGRKAKLNVGFMHFSDYIS